MMLFANLAIFVTILTITIDILESTTKLGTIGWTLVLLFWILGAITFNACYDVVEK